MSSHAWCAACSFAIDKKKKKTPVKTACPFISQESWIFSPMLPFKGNDGLGTFTAIQGKRIRDEIINLARNRCYFLMTLFWMSFQLLGVGRSLKSCRPPTSQSIIFRAKWDIRNSPTIQIRQVVKTELAFVDRFFAILALRYKIYYTVPAANKIICWNNESPLKNCRTDID